MSAAQMLSSNKNKRSPATLSGSPRKEGGLGTAKQLGGKSWLLPFLKNPADYRGSERTLLVKNYCSSFYKLLPLGVVFIFVVYVLCRQVY